MSAQMLEFTLARLYTDPIFRTQFLTDSVEALKSCELTEHERQSLLKIDKAGLLMASRSFLHKRKKRLLNQSIFRRVIFKLKIAMTNLMGKFK